MIRNDEGLTKTYNRFHDPDERRPDIVELRRLHDADGPLQFLTLTVGTTLQLAANFYSITKSTRMNRVGGKSLGGTAGRKVFTTRFLRV